jgi:hypothetical protein
MDSIHGFQEMDQSAIACVGDIESILPIEVNAYWPEEAFRRRQPVLRIPVRTASIDVTLSNDREWDSVRNGQEK